MAIRRTEKQIEASRRNGRRSKGPVTAAGKAKSSRNSFIHGLTATAPFVLHTEGDRIGFDELHRAFVHKFQPQDALEADLVLEAAGARWRLRRAWGLENHLFEMEIEHDAQWIDKRFVDISTNDRQARAFTHLSNTATLSSLHRYATRIRREFEKAIHDLEFLRSKRFASTHPDVAPDDFTPSDFTPSDSPVADANLQNEPDANPSETSAETPAEAPAGNLTDTNHVADNNRDAPQTTPSGPVPHRANHTAEPRVPDTAFLQNEPGETAAPDPIAA